MLPAEQQRIALDAQPGQLGRRPHQWCPWECKTCSAPWNPTEPDPRMQRQPCETYAPGLYPLALSNECWPHHVADPFQTTQQPIIDCAKSEFQPICCFWLGRISQSLNKRKFKYIQI